MDSVKPGPRGRKAGKARASRRGLRVKKLPFLTIDLNHKYRDEEKLIMGVFDESCMGMYKAIIPDELLHPTGVYKERLSQLNLYVRIDSRPNEHYRQRMLKL